MTGRTFIGGWLFLSVAVLWHWSSWQSSANIEKGKKQQKSSPDTASGGEEGLLQKPDPNPRLIANQPPERFVNNVELQMLDKITGRASKVEAKIGTRIIFERLEIEPLKCWKSFPEENPENKLLLKIFEVNRQSGKSKRIFYGWIFSSTPSISGLEHPLYDVKLKNCSE
jgi:hypothetical protein